LCCGTGHTGTRPFSTDFVQQVVLLLSEVGLPPGNGAGRADDPPASERPVADNPNPRLDLRAVGRRDRRAWVTFASRADGIGHDLAVTGFGSVTTSRLRVALTGQVPTEVYTPTMTEIAVYHTGQ
jgi:hypothetical protein